MCELYSTRPSFIAMQSHILKRREIASVSISRMIHFILLGNSIFALHGPHKMTHNIDLLHEILCHPSCKTR
jgi:hypothetical protein